MIAPGGCVATHDRLIQDLESDDGEEVHVSQADGRRRVVYLDYNATAPLRPEAIAAINSSLTTVGNASSTHVSGQAANRTVEAARQHVADLLNCSRGEITFTSGATEANNIAIASAVTATCGPIVISSIEHPAVLEAAFAFAGPERVRVVPVSAEGLVDLEELRSALRDGATLVSVMAANNETGVIQDLPSVVKAARDAGALVHTDATQLVGRLPIDVFELDIDLLSLSAHKFGGPQGVGALFARRGIPLVLKPLAFGGGHEKGRRPGTYNVPGIAGLGAAASAAKAAMLHEAPRIAALRDRLEGAVVAALPRTWRNGRANSRLPGVASITFADTPADAVLTAMPHVAASIGSACSSGAIEPSHVLLAMGLTPDEADSTIRFSIGFATTDEDIQEAITCIRDAVIQVRKALQVTTTNAFGRTEERNA